MISARTALLVFSSAALLACGTPSPLADAARDVVSPDVRDVAVEAARACSADVDCDDGVYCNGAERCGASGSGRVCTAGTLPCVGSTLCHESTRSCSTPDGGTDAGSDADSDVTTDVGPSCADDDHDGHPDVACGGDDCDDHDAMRFPGNAETCAGARATTDEDCDPCTVAGAGTDGDADSDTIPSPNCVNPWLGTSAPLCDARRVHVFDATASSPHRANTVEGADCDDGNATVSPLLPEVCGNLRDDNCDGLVDVVLAYRDRDGDGHGDRLSMITTSNCTAPTGYALSPDDCDDMSASVHPGAAELCDRRDNDCSGTTAGAFDPSEDADGDGHAPTTAACSGGPFPRDDCDDTVATTYSGATELCNGVDDDCSLPAPNTGLRDAAEDADGDGHAPAAATCTGGSLLRDDCDDTDPLTFPGAIDWCDGIADRDCSNGGSPSDEDADGDGFASATACVGRGSPSAPPGTLPVGDCDDSHADSYPGATERCDGRLNDCRRPGDVDLDTTGNGGLCTAGVCVQGRCANVLELAGGVARVCARFDDGSVSCWGHNAEGELGDGTTTSRSVPRPVSGLSGAAGIAIGMNHSCALVSDGTVWCWGYNSEGQLGDGTRTMRLTPVQVMGVSGAVQIDAGSASTCARVATGDVYCWGTNQNGALGTGSTTFDSVSPARVLLRRPAIDFALGRLHGCAVLDDHTLQCWGSNFGGETGPDAGSSTPHDVAAGFTIVDVDAGETATCIRLMDDTVRCFGLIPSGVLSRTPATIPGLGTVTDLYATSSKQTFCARATDGTLRCWGPNSSGELGIGRGLFGSGATAPVGIGAILGATTGRDFTCAILADGRVRCWGRNDVYGSLGGGYASIVSPRRLFALASATSLTVRGAVHPDGTVSQWGTDVATPPFTTPVIYGLPRVVAGFDSVATFSLLSSHALALTTTGGAVGWGNNTYGQLGDGTTTQRTMPVMLPLVTNAVEIDVGEGFTCSRRTDNSVQCWGRNDAGQLGDGTMTNRSTPGAATLAADVIGLGVGWTHACAVIMDGTARCWGDNAMGQLGSGAAAMSSPSPVVVADLSRVTAVSSGGSTSCARLDDGTLRCWGDGSSGELGDGRRMSTRAPSFVRGLADVNQVSVGGAYACAIRSDASVWCWGANASGQIGDGTRTERDVPTLVSTVPAARSIVAGPATPCALASDGSAYCWGLASLGETGTFELQEWVPTSYVHFSGVSP